MTTGKAHQRLAARPTLTIVFCAAVLFWAGCAAAYSASKGLEAQDCGLIAAASTAAGLSLLAAIALLKTKAPAIAACACIFGIALGAAFGMQLHQLSQSLPEGGHDNVPVRLIEDSQDIGFAETACARAVIDGREATFSCQFKVGDRHLYGDRIIATVKYAPADFSEDSYNWGDGACGSLSVDSYEPVAPPFPESILLDVRSRAIEAIGCEDASHALLQALVCGYRRSFGKLGEYAELYSAFQACGLAHLVAVSGAHLVIVTGLFSSLFKLMRFPRRLTAGLLIGLMCSYLVLSGMPVSALRATVMSSVGVLSIIGKRRPSSLNALGICLFALITASPESSVSVSLALSALSTAGIVLFAPLIQSWFDATPLSRVPPVADALALTFSASVLSQLYAASLFNQLPIVSPLSNVVCSPLFPLVCGLGLIAGVAGASGLPGAAILTWLASLPGALLNAIVSGLAAIDFASIPFSMDPVAALAVSAGIASLLWAAWPSGRRIAPALVAATALVAAFLLVPGNADEIVMLDVGQGDAILVRSQGKSLLVDTGNKDALLRRELGRNRVMHLDAVLITHADDDHCGSLDVLERLVPVDRVIVARDMTTCTGASARNLMEQARRVSDDVVGVDLGDAFSFGRFSFEVIWPHGFAEDGGNADSLCVLARYDGDADGRADSTALFTGDAEKAELERMIQEGRVGDIDILKVGHHGSRNGMTEQEADRLHPEVALISCGENNRYGHPTSEILDMLENIGAKTFRTDRDGEVRCTLTPSGVSVACLH